MSLVRFESNYNIPNMPQIRQISFKSPILLGCDAEIRWRGDARCRIELQKSSKKIIYEDLGKRKRESGATKQTGWFPVDAMSCKRKCTGISLAGEPVHKEGQRATEEK